MDSGGRVFPVGVLSAGVAMGMGTPSCVSIVTSADSIDRYPVPVCVDGGDVGMLLMNGFEFIAVG